MKRIITAAVTAVLMLNITVFASDGESRYVREPEPFDGSAITYEPYDVKALDKLIDDTRALLKKPGNDKKIIAQAEALYNEYTKAAYAAIVAQLMSDRYYDADDDTAGTRPARH